MYVDPNFKTKKELKDAVKSGKRISVYSPGLGSPNMNGVEYVEGPHFPEPHRWYAKVQVQNGLVVKVLS